MEKGRITLLDGGMGTMLQKYGLDTGEIPEVLNLTQPDMITRIHSDYVEAGSDIVYTNTFGCNRYKLEGSGHSVAEIVDAAVKNARAACKDGTRVAGDIGPLGKMLEPAGTVSFEEAYEAFKEIAVQAQKSGVDLMVVETMTDLYEMKAAVLACKENTDLEIMASMSFEESGRTFTGCSIEAMAMTLEGLGVDRIGINCSLGPIEILPLAERLCKATKLPVFIKPNAGLPDPKTGEYDITPEIFVDTMEKYLDLGIGMLGGCCGTNPEYIEGIAQLIEKRADDVKPEQVRCDENEVTQVCTPTRVVKADHMIVCGERLNPTGKKRLKQAIIEGDTNYVLKQAVLQEDQGAEVLDVNVGVPGIDEEEILPGLIKKIQSVTDLPLQIDSSNPDAIEAALRVYNGKAIVNSVNGEEKSLERVLPIVKKYGAALVCLTLDEDGIPESTQKRIDVAKKIIDRATEIGIPKKDLIVDCLTLTASAQQAGVGQTLDAIRIVTEELGLCTTLGVSNVSFGLPNRPLINRTFLTLAIQSGLGMAIMDPGDMDMMAAVATCEMLHNVDVNAEKYIDKFADFQGGIASAAAQNNQGQSAEVKTDEADQTERSDIYYVLKKGLEEDTAEMTRSLLETHDELTIVGEHLIPALDAIGKDFETGKIFLPQMIQAATAAQAGFDVIKTSMQEKGEENIFLGKVIIATVKGDVHDIGKNIVKVIMENYGFDVIDLGKDVPAEDIVYCAEKNDIDIIGLSALMTTTLGSMENTITELKKVRPACKVLVGGAVVTQEYADSIGADYYCQDAMKAVEAARDAAGA